MRSTMSMVAVVGVVMLGLAGPAAAQIDPVGEPIFQIQDPDGISSIFSSGMPSAQTELGASTFAMELTGDITVMTLPTVRQSEFDLLVHQYFMVGPLPVSVNFALERDFKLVLAGEDPSFGGFTPEVAVTTGGGVRSVQGNFPITNRSTFDAFEGPEIVLVDDLLLDEPVLLGPGLLYRLSTSIGIEIDHGTNVDDTLPATLTMELGGISDFDGLTSSLAYEVVPEPSSAALLALGSVLLLPRRSRASRGGL